MSHPITRRALLAGAAALAACRTSAEPGAAWLLSRQGADGGFHSEAYGFLRPGGALTGLCLLALAPHAPRSAAERGLAFLRAAGPAAPPDYPTYAAALAILAARAVSADPLPAHRAYLLAQQRLAGFEGHAAYGGFGIGAPSPPAPPHAGHVNLSMTRRAMEALAPTDPAAVAAARQFARGCRADDGGFTYSYEHAVNKGATPRSGYGTATCDGALALIAAGDPADEPVIAAATERLRATFRPDANPGVGAAFAEYGRAMRFYWRAGVADVFARRGGPPGWQDALTHALRSEQRPDGSWKNEDARQKEDDPLVATSLALLALAKAR